MKFTKFKEVISTLFSIVRHKNTQFLFRTPKKAGVLILDSIDVNRLKAALFQEIDYAVLDTRYGHDELKFRVNISPRVIYLTIRMLITGQHPWVSYCYAITRCVSPKVVIDNIHLPYVLPLAQELPDIDFFILSNGFWNDVLDRSVVESFYTYSLKEKFQQHPQKVCNFHVFCFGKKDSDIFRQNGLDEETTGIRYHDVGSLFGDYMKSLMCSAINKNDYDIVFVSQCEQDSIMGTGKFHKLMVENTSKAITNLSRYLAETGKCCLILLRGRPNSESSEIAFYRSLFDQSAHIEFHRNDGAFAVYEGLTKAPVIISLFSTTGFEAMSWGKKVVFCLYGFTKIYKISSDRYKSDMEMLQWSLETPGYAEFKKHLDTLIEINSSDYLSQIAEIVNYIISGSSGKPAHVYIRDMILTKLGQARPSMQQS